MSIAEVGVRPGQEIKKPEPPIRLIQVEGVEDPFKVEQLEENLIYRVDLNPYLERELGPDWDQEFLAVARNGTPKETKGGEAPTSLMRSHFVTKYRVLSALGIEARLPKLYELAQGPLLRLSEGVLRDSLKPAPDKKHWINMNYHIKTSPFEVIMYEGHPDRNTTTDLVAVTTLEREQGGITQIWKTHTLTDAPREDELDEYTPTLAREKIARWESLSILEKIWVLRESGTFEHRMKDRKNLLAELSPKKGFGVIFRGDILPHSVTPLEMHVDPKTGLMVPTERLVVPIDYDSQTQTTELGKYWNNKEMDRALLGENGKH